MKDLIEIIDDYMCEKTDFILATEFYREQYSYYVIKEKKQYWIITYANIANFHHLPPSIAS